MRIIISNKNQLLKLKSAIKKDGYSNLHILSDFDRTLTYGTINGVKTPSIISMLRDGKHLSEDYAKKAHKLFDKYHPTEIDPKISLKKKKLEMQKWWKTHNKLLIKSGLNKKDIEDIVQNGHVKFREGVPEFLDFLYRNNIPLVILSASGCGDAIQLFFKKIGKDYPNIHYVTNKLNYDSNGNAISQNGKIIHCMNKDETILEEIPEVYNQIKNRKNVILLGDSISDLGMIKGFKYQNLIKIGFLNNEYNKSREAYKKKFDITLEGDKDFYQINKLIKELV